MSRNGPICLSKPLLFVSLLLAMAPLAHADTQAATGRVVALLVVESTSDDYALHHGEVTVGDPIGGFATYKWGGSYCPGKDLPEASVAALHRALDEPRVVVQPFTKSGQGGALCIVAVRYILRNEQGLFP